MGILAIVDTFLVYKIAEFRYNRNVAFNCSCPFCCDATNLVDKKDIIGFNPVAFSSLIDIVLDLHKKKSNKKQQK